MTALRLGSLFDGIGVFPLAAVRCGIEPVWASEIENAPISITKRHFPDMVHLGRYGQTAGLHFPGNYKLFPQVHIITKRAHFDGGNGQNIFKISKTVH